MSKKNRRRTKAPARRTPTKRKATAKTSANAHWNRHSKIKTFYAPAKAKAPAPIATPLAPPAPVWDYVPPPERALGEYLKMLGTMRPHGTGAPDSFAKDWLTPLGAKRDACGNYLLAIGDAPVIWSSHIDTVHRKEGKQRLTYSNGLLRLHSEARKGDSNCLGADCTTGVWLMREMILARRPGLYIFHAGEERGGIGSSYIRDKTPHIVEGARACIAFDRRGTKSVITKQAWSRCCSDKFGQSLAAALDMGHELDDGGLFTDSANYTDLIGECSNLSVGYHGEHSNEESQEVDYLFALRESLLRLDTDSLVYERAAGEDDPEDRVTSYAYAYSESYGNRYRLENTAGGWASTLDGEDRYAAESSDRRLMRRIIEQNPSEVMSLLEDYGIGIDELADAVYERGGAIPSEINSRANLEKDY